MKKQFKLMALASAAMLFAACSQEDLLSPQEQLAQAPENNVIQFGTYLGKTGTTRAAGTVTQNYNNGAIANKDAEGTSHLARAGFGVFAYYTKDKDYDPTSGTGTWRTEGTAEKYPNFMYNQKLEYYATNADATTLNGYNSGEYWTYNPVKYWPNGNDKANSAGSPSNTAIQNAEGKLSFYAYAPYMEVGTTTTTGTLPTGVTAVNVNTPKTYTPVGGSATNNGIVAISQNTSTSNVWVKYVMPSANATDAVDLLWGVRGKETYNETDNTSNTQSTWNAGNLYNVNLTKQKVNEKVKFLFKHALTKIGGQTVAAEDNTKAPETTDQCAFKVVLDIDGNTGDGQSTYLGSNFTNTKTLVTIKELKIRDAATVKADNDVTGFTETTSNLFTSGWFNIETGTWANIADAGATVKIVANNTPENDANVTDANYSLNPVIKEIGIGSGKKNLDTSDKSIWSTANPTGVTTTAQPVFASENVPGILMIPGGSAQSLYVTLEYYVRTADKNLAVGYSEVLQKITNKVDLSGLNTNKFYTIIMHIGLTSVKFEAVVADWATTDNGTYDENGTYTPGTGSNPIEDKVWLPSNVVTVTP